MNFALGLCGLNFTFDLQDIEAIVIILGIVGSALLGIYHERPRKTDDIDIMSYVDDESHEKVEVRKIGLNWGRIFFLNHLTLRPVALNAKYELNVTPITNITKILLPSFYDEKIGLLHRSVRTVRLTNRAYFKREVNDKVSMIIRTPIGDEYRQNVHVEPSKKDLVIVNENPCEIRNYRFTIPADVAIDRLGAGIESVRIEIATKILPGILDQRVRDFRSDEIPIGVIVESVPTKTGTLPGTVKISLTPTDSSLS